MKKLIFGLLLLLSPLAYTDWTEETPLGSGTWGEEDDGTSSISRIFNTQVIFSSNVVLPSAAGSITGAGEGSGLDADLIDGVGSSLLARTTGYSLTGNLNINPSVLFNGNIYSTGSIRGVQLGVGTTDFSSGWLVIGGTRTATPLHNIQDISHINLQSSDAFACLDLSAEMTGPKLYDHFVALQARPEFSGSTGISSRFDTIHSGAIHSGTGTIVNARGVHIADMGGTGPITNNYGLYIDGIYRGTNDYSIWTAGGNHMFGGNATFQTSTDGWPIQITVPYNKNFAADALTIRSNDATEEAAVEFYMIGGSTQSERGLRIQTLEDKGDGIVSGNIVLQPSGGWVGVGKTPVAAFSVNGRTDHAMTIETDDGSHYALLIQNRSVKTNFSSCTYIYQGDDGAVNWGNAAHEMMVWNPAGYMDICENDIYVSTDTTHNTPIKANQNIYCADGVTVDGVDISTFSAYLEATYLPLDDASTMYISVSSGTETYLPKTGRLHFIGTEAVFGNSASDFIFDIGEEGAQTSLFRQQWSRSANALTMQAYASGQTGSSIVITGGTAQPITVNGNLVATGTVQGTFIIGNGSLLTDIPGIGDTTIYARSTGTVFTGNISVVNDGADPNMLIGDDSQNNTYLGYDSSDNAGSLQSYGANVGSLLSLNPQGGDVAVGRSAVTSNLTIYGNSTSTGIVSGRVIATSGGTGYNVLGSSVIVYGSINSTEEKDWGITISTPYAIGIGTGTWIPPTRSYAITITTMTAHVDGGTSVSFRLEQRSLNNENTSGVDVMSAAVTATTAGQIGGTIADGTIPADTGLYLVITGVVGNVDRFYIKGRYTRD